MKQSSTPSLKFNEHDITLRDAVRPEDVAAVREIVESTGFFAPYEVEIAVELVQERLARGEASGYDFVFADVGDRPIGYVCHGPIACTVASYDMFWLAVRNEFRGRGLGRLLVLESERRIALAGGRRVYIETSSRAQYEPTRRFYERCGYVEEARLADFYAPGDGKVVFVRVLNPPREGEAPAEPHR